MNYCVCKMYHILNYDQFAADLRQERIALPNELHYLTRDP